MTHALRILDFDRIQEALSHHAETEMGKDHSHDLLPSFDESEVKDRLAETAEAIEIVSAGGLPTLSPVRDIREALNRAGKGGRMDGASLFHVAEALSVMRSCRSVLKSRSSTSPKLYGFAESLPELGQLEEKLFKSLESDGSVLSSASPELSRCRKAIASAQQSLTSKIHSYTTGKYRDYLSDPIYTVRDGRYVVPVKAEHKGKIRGIVHDRSSTGQTLFVEPEDVLHAGNNLREAEAAEKAEVEKILQNLSERTGVHAIEIALGIESIGFLDFAFAKARYGEQINACLPIVGGAKHRIWIDHGRHPMLDPKVAVPLTIEVGGETDGLLITGPNTGGKTVAIKTVGLFVAMSQSGLMLPAQEVRLGVFSQLWADIGDEQSLSQNLSTFSAHIKNISEAIRSLMPGGLVLLDEVGAGTDPSEGAALAKAVLLRIQESGAKVMASTHYGELKMFAYTVPGFANAAMEFDLKTLSPTYRLLLGAPGASHALSIAERCGIDSRLIESARNQMGTDRRDVSDMLEKLEVAQKRARTSQSDADRLSAKLKRVEEETESKLAEAKERLRTAKQQAAEALEESLRELRLEAMDIFASAKKGGADLEDARARMKQLMNKGADVASSLKPEVQTPTKTVELVAGTRVRVTGYNQDAVILDPPRDGKARVQVGSLKMIFPTHLLTPIAESAQPPKNPYQQASRKETKTQLQKAMYATTEIHVRGYTAEEAIETISKFIDEALLAGLPTIRIVHGKGEGILRKAVFGFLKSHPGVASMHEADANEGGQGATIAILK